VSVRRFRRDGSTWPRAPVGHAVPYEVSVGRSAKLSTTVSAAVDDFVVGGSTPDPHITTTT
jgi:hypothetical protein